MADISWKFLKIEKIVEIMNSKQQVQGKLGHMVQIRICHLT